MKKIAIIGGGAAGFFAALTCAEKHKDYQVIILEKTTKLLSKVKISGGGRCNVTHACLEISKLSKHYPRGEKFLKNTFHQFSVKDTLAWFEQRGVLLKTESDKRIFPVSDNSQTIIDCFLRESQKLGIEIRTSTDVEKMTLNSSNKGNIFTIYTKNYTEEFYKVIIATGGMLKAEHGKWLQDLGMTIKQPVPSLFTFNIPKNPITELMGVAVPTVKARIADTKLAQEGAILVTHWGLSAYAVLKLSAWGARILADKNYQFTVLLSWLCNYNEEQLRKEMYELKQNMATRQVGNKNPFGLPNRLWDFFMQKLAIKPDKRWADLTKIELNQIVNILLNDSYEVQGKTTFKEEFVTCGGISLDEIDYNTMQAKKVKGLYFAGEVLDIDGITGGFNFQAAWTTGYIAGQLSE